MADLEKMYISQEGYDRGDDGEDGLTIRSEFLVRAWKTAFYLHFTLHLFLFYAAA